MPTLKVICRDRGLWRARTGSAKYHDDEAFESVISYCIRPEKTPTDWIGGFGVNINQAAFEMKRLAKAYGKESGLRLRHMVLSFSAEETKQLGAHALETIYKIAAYAAGYYGMEHQIIYAVHEDAKNYHVHFVMNTVSFLDGKKYRGNKGDYYRFQAYLKSFLQEYYNLSLRVCSDRA